MVNDVWRINSIAQALFINRRKVDRWLDCALQPEPLTVPDGLPRFGEPPNIFFF